MDSSDKLDINNISVLKNYGNGNMKGSLKNDLLKSEKRIEANNIY
jgi:hypothetical protein